MKSLLKKNPLAIGLMIAVIVSAPYCRPGANDKTHSDQVKSEPKGEGQEENEAYDGPEQAAKFEFNRTKDPALNAVPTQRLVDAEIAAQLSQMNAPSFISSYGSWTERGPNSDVAGPFGNSRPNADVTAGRVRTIMVDGADATGKTVFAGGVDGGIWKTTDITSATPNWVLVNDFFLNMAISGMCQDPTNANTIYFCTGESYFNADAVRGAGIFKSTDHGATFTQLSSTTSFTQCTRILCDAGGNVYVGMRGLGLRRSNNGGTSWTTITPTGMNNDICDLEISSTNRLHVVSGIFSTQIYRYVDLPAIATSADFQAPATAFPSFAMRAEIAVSGNTLYACPANTSYQVPTIYKSTDGGANWAATAGQPTSGWASGQGWYSLSVVINPADANQCIVGGLDNYKTSNGGTSWTKISTWVGNVGQYVHADQHTAVWYNAGNILLFGSDGGVFYTTDGGTTIRDRNKGLRIKQFYSCAAHPTSGSNYFLAGAQDNGCHAFSSAGLGASTEVTGGDGAFVHIDQDEPQYQFTSYLYNQYWRSTNSGSTWTSVTLSSSTGQFINPTDYDNTANIMYCASSPATYRRWTNPQTGSASAEVTITALNGNTVSAVTVSPYTANRVYLATGNDVATSRVCYVDNANTIASGSAGTNISTGLPTNTYASCIAVGKDDQHLMVSYSNYGVQQIWVSVNGGTSWTNIDGNLPDMPVNWCMFAPNDDTKAIIATEAGVWLTQSINGSSTAWIASPTFPVVRTDMLQYRSSDGMLVAATHGRGLWTQSANSILPLNNFVLKGTWAGKSADLSWTYADLPDGSKFEVETSPDAIHFSTIGTVQKTAGSNYTFSYNAPGNLFYRIKGIENTGEVRYSNIVKLFRSGSSDAMQILQLFPNPVQNTVNVLFTTTDKGPVMYTITNAAGQTMWHSEENIYTTGSHSTAQNITSLKAGTYIFTITLNGKKISKAFLKR